MDVFHSIESSFFSKLSPNYMNPRDNAYNPPTTQAKFEFAVTQPSIIQRCNLLDQFLSDCLPRDASVILHSLLENIFGTISSPGWGIRSLSRLYHPREFDCVRCFLSPRGQLFKLIHNLCEEPHSRYDFPITCLPDSSQKIIADGGLPTFYLDKIIPTNLNSTRVPFTVSLNSFELFMFHFAHYFGNQSHQPHNILHNSPDSLYITLVDDYLMYYVPCDLLDSPPPFLFSSQTPRQSSAHSTLLRMKQWSPSQSEIHTQAAAEIWPAQVVISIFCEFWFQCQINEGGMCFSTPNLPSAEQIRVVRLFIKHLHYFVNSSLVGGIPDRTGYKRLLWPHIYKQVYNFLKQCIERWPLDSSFRLIIEVWLSLIQPWRYTNVLTRHGQRDPMDGVKEVTIVWSPFITENILFYSGIFQAVMGRMLKMDLTSPKNALVLFRVTKIFSLPNLLSLIQTAEDKLTSQPMLSLSQDFAKEAFMPMMSLETRSKVIQLVQAMAEAHQNVSIAQQQHETLAPQFPLSSFSQVWLYLFGSSHIDQLYAEQAIVMTHLKSAIENLTILYKLEPAVLVPQSPPTICGSSDSVDSGQNLTPNDKLCILNRMKSPKVVYTGNPDLIPIQSTECKFLVRGLYQISSCINEKVGENISNCYYLDGFIGRFFRQVFLPPTSCISYQKLPSGHNTKVTQHLPPRVGLRRLATYRFIFFSIVSCMVCHFMGIGVTGFMFSVLLAFILKCFIWALWDAE